MSHIQTFLVLGGLILLTILILNFYNITGVQTDTQIDSEAVISAISIGQSILEEISTKSFDERTTTSIIGTPDSLTLISQLGPDPGETSRILFDDVDDYNGFISHDSLSGLGKFDYKIKVYYTSSTNTNQISLIRTFCKRVDVSLKNNYLRDTLKLNRIMAF